MKELRPGGSGETLVKVLLFNLLDSQSSLKKNFVTLESAGNIDKYD